MTRVPIRTANATRSSSDTSTAAFTPSTTTLSDNAPERDVPIRSIETESPEEHIPQTPSNSSKRKSTGTLSEESILPRSTSSSSKRASDSPWTPPATSPDSHVPLDSDQDLETSASAIKRRAGPQTSSSGLSTSISRPSLSPMPREDGSLTPRRRHRSSSRVGLPRHAVSDEEPPENSPFYRPAFQKSIRASGQLMADLANVLATCSLHTEPDSAIKKFFEEARKLSHFSCPETRTVGIVGDSGCGKSSLVNSLLDLRGLARSSNSGAACTCVATEYHYHEKGDFVIEIEWFSQNDINLQLSELLNAYRAYHFARLDANVAPDAEQRDALDDAKNKAELAQDTFRAMFPNRLDTPDEVDQLLDDNVDNVLTRLVSWSTAGRPNAAAAERETYLDVQSCSDRLTDLTSEPISQTRSAAWPYIRKIKVRSNAYILSKGLILVDLPGLRDLNSARRNITERYLLEVDEIFAVCPIGRAVTDAGLQAVFDLAEQAKLTSVGIICTKSDDFREEEALKDLTGRQQRQAKEHRNKVYEAQQELIECEEDIRAFRKGELDESSISASELLNIEQEARDLLHRQTFAEKQFLVTARNEFVTGKLKKTYSRRIHGSLNVFCVSNTDYWGVRDKPRHEAEHVLELSGILAVRRHCVSIVTKVRYELAVRYILHEIPAVLSSIHLWVESGSGSLTAETKSKMQQAFDQAERELEKELMSPRSVLNGDTMRTLFQSEIAEDQSWSVWAHEAEQAAMDWQGWHHASYKSFCSNFGDHCTKTVGSRNWNLEVAEAMARDMDAPWQSLTLGTDEWYKNAKNSVTRAWYSMIEILRSGLGADARSTWDLVEGLRHREHLLIAEIQAHFDETNDQLATLAATAFTGIRTSFVSEALRPAYIECNSEYGTGSDARRKRIMKDKVKDPRLFRTCFRQLENSYSAIAEKLRENLRRTVSEHINDVSENLNLLRDENVVLESERYPEFRIEVERGVEAAKNKLQKIHDAI